MKKQKTSEKQLSVEESIREDQKVLEDSSTPDNPKKKVRLTLGSSLFGLMTLGIAVLGIIISIDGIIQLKEWNAGLKNFQEQIDKKLYTEQQHLNTLENALKEISTRQKTLDQQLHYYHSIVLPALQKKQSVDVLWQLEKSYNWLQQAQLDLRWSGDWQSALLLLKASANVIEQFKIAQLQPISLSIMQSIAELSAIKLTNEIDLLNQIKNISDEVVILPAPELSSQASKANSSQSTQVLAIKQSGWTEMWHRGWDSIKKIVVIKPTDDNSNSERPANSRQMLNDRLFLIFQQIQWALLKKDNALFHWSITQAMNLIQQNEALIDIKNEKTMSCLSHLKALEQENLTPALPDLDPVCYQLKNYIDNLSNQPKMSEVLEKTV